MKISPFLLERYFARHEFTARYLLCSSDCEAMRMSELIALADEETHALWKELKLGYTETRGHPLLREAIATLYRGISAEEIVTVVPEEGIFLLMHALLEPGDHVVCTSPAYQSLYEVARSIGCDVAMWQPAEDRGWTFQLERLERSLQERTKLVVVNFPHNPTGALPSRDAFFTLVNIVKRCGAYLFSDEMYRLLEIDPGSTLPAGCELYDRAITLFGLSKTFGLPGLRVGWLATRASDLLERVTALKDYTTICGSAPAEILATIALRRREEILAQQLLRVRRNLDALDSFFAAHAGAFRWQRPRGGSICFPRMEREPDTAAFCEALLADTGIMLAPSAIFDYGDHHVRIGFGRDDLPEVLGLFSDYLAARYA